MHAYVKRANTEARLWSRVRVRFRVSNLAARLSSSGTDVIRARAGARVKARMVPLATICRSAPLPNLVLWDLSCIADCNADL